jgi:hypothetical protein
MKNLPQHIEYQFFKFLNKEISIEEFEQWVYATDELETALSPDIYQNLIAFNYNSRYVLATLYPLLMECLDFPKFEKYRLIYHLNLIIEKDNSWQKAVKKLDHEFRENYDFLNIFCALDDMLNYDEDKYGTNPNSIDDLFIESKFQAIKMKNWLNSGTIIIKGREGHRKGTNFIDNRIESEK